ncbi:MAG: hypothetical protein AAB492_03030 [Patescibacteria group bacterium]
MGTDISRQDVLFEVSDYSGVMVRTTLGYWKKIKTEKHKELTVEYDIVMQVIQTPDEVYRSVQDEFIKLFYRKIQDKYLVVVIKYIGNTGFVVTCYETIKTKRKGEKIWPM